MDQIKTMWVGIDKIILEKSRIKKNIYNWLTLPNNLTNTLKQTGVFFSLNVHSLSFETPFSDEIDAFNDYPIDASYSLVRKVFLEGNGTPMIFARVIIPKLTYLNYQNELSGLGSAAIGNAFLYNKKDVIRKYFEYKLINAQDDLFHELQDLNHMNNGDELWARRSIFVMPKGYLLITEVFLNTITTYPN